MKAPEPTAEAPALALPTAGEMSPAALMAMQQGMGNAAVSAMLRGRRESSSTFSALPGAAGGAGADMAWPPPSLTGRPATNGAATETAGNGAAGGNGAAAGPEAAALSGANGAAAGLGAASPEAAALAGANGAAAGPEAAALAG
ncbi:hypothetical protein OJ997_29310, partial [Solirubrobacter phytolaccae]